MDMPLTIRRMRNKICFHLLNLEEKNYRSNATIPEHGHRAAAILFCGPHMAMGRKHLSVIPYAHASDSLAPLPWTPSSHRLGKQGHTFDSISQDLTYKTQTLNVHLSKTLQGDTAATNERDYVADFCELCPGDQYSHPREKSL